MKTNTNIKRGVKHSIKHRAQRKYKTHKNKHTKTQLKQYKTHKGGAGPHDGPQLLFSGKHPPPQKTSSIFSFFSRSKKQGEPLSVTTEHIVSLYDIKTVVITPDNINSFISDHTIIISKTPEFKNTKCKTITFKGNNFLKTTKEQENTLEVQTLETLIQNGPLEHKLLSEAINIITKVYTSITHLIFGTPTNHNADMFMLETLPETINNLKDLQTLMLINCETLTLLPDTIGSLNKLTTLLLIKCTVLKNLPDTIGSLNSLKFLWLKNCYALRTLPHTIGKLQALTTFELEYDRANPEDKVTLPITIWLLTKCKPSVRGNIKLVNPEILYLMPKIHLTEKNAASYLSTIRDNHNNVYSDPISDIVDMLKLNPTDKDNYLKNIPYNLDLKLSIKEQIDKFTEERTKIKTIILPNLNIAPKTPPNIPQEIHYFPSEAALKAYLERNGIKETDYGNLFNKYEVGTDPNKQT